MEEVDGECWRWAKFYPLNILLYSIWTWGAVRYLSHTFPIMCTSNFGPWGMIWHSKNRKTAFLGWMRLKVHLHGVLHSEFGFASFMKVVDLFVLVSSSFDSLKLEFVWQRYSQNTKCVSAAEISVELSASCAWIFFCAAASIFVRIHASARNLMHNSLYLFHFGVYLEIILSN